MGIKTSVRTFPDGGAMLALQAPHQVGIHRRDNAPIRPEKGALYSVMRDIDAHCARDADVALGVDIVANRDGGQLRNRHGRAV